MLPPPKRSDHASISSVLRSDAEITVLKSVVDEVENPFGEEDNIGSGFKKPMLEIKSSDLIDKDDFYRNQLKKHSVMQFRNQTLDRMR